MAIKGLAYIKTQWNFQERPVASSKLNNWDDQIEQSLELLNEILSLAWGGGDGVLRNAAEKDVKVEANSPQDMTVIVRSGRAFISKFLYKLASDITSPPLTEPTTNPRIDLIQATLSNWSISVKEGTEEATPSPPSPDADAIPLAEIYLRVGMASIKDVDDGTNGYITDVRTFL